MCDRPGPVSASAVHDRRYEALVDNLLDEQASEEQIRAQMQQIAICATT